jgi:hypothetical protein
VQQGARAAQPAGRLRDLGLDHGIVAQHLLRSEPRAGLLGLRQRHERTKAGVGDPERDAREADAVKRQQRDVVERPALTAV